MITKKEKEFLCFNRQTEKKHDYVDKRDTYEGVK